MRLRLLVSNSAPTASATLDVLANQSALEFTPALTLLDGPSPGTVFRLDGGRTRRAFIAGRAAEADISIPDDTVSRRHARIWIQKGDNDDRAMVEDLQSTNGTFVNGQKAFRTKLERGDRLTLGSVIFRFDLLDPVEVKVVEEMESRVQEAYTDSLTGLQTRRFLGDIEAAASPAGGTVSAILVDLDHFKKVNDTFGHGVGDQVLKRAAASLRDCLRAQDLAIRWGGEEFLAVLPSADLLAAASVADRILNQIRARDVEDLMPGGALSASLGVAMTRPGESFKDLIDRADQALYEAKNDGRDRVEISE